MSRKGLSLMEVLIAVTIFSFTLISLFLLLRTGIFVRGKIEGKQSVIQNIYLNLENIARELRNSVSFYEDESGFKTEGGVLEFYSSVFDYSLDSPKVSHFSYSFNDKALTKTIEDPLTLEIIKKFNLIEDLESAKFYYFDIDTGKWQDSWEDVKVLPYGVRIEVFVKEKNGEILKLDKYVHIPQ